MVVIEFFSHANCNVRGGNQSEEGEGGAEEGKEKEEDEEEEEKAEDLLETRALGPLLSLASDSTRLWVYRMGIADLGHSEHQNVSN